MAQGGHDFLFFFQNKILLYLLSPTVLTISFTVLANLKFLHFQIKICQHQQLMDPVENCSWEILYNISLFKKISLWSCFERNLVTLLGRWFPPSVLVTSASKKNLLRENSNFCPFPFPVFFFSYKIFKASFDNFYP